MRIGGGHRIAERPATVSCGRHPTRRAPASISEESSARSLTRGKSPVRGTSRSTFSTVAEAVATVGQSVVVRRTVVGVRVRSQAAGFTTGKARPAARNVLTAHTQIRRGDTVS